MSEIAGISARADSQRQRGWRIVRAAAACLAACGFAFLLGFVAFVDHVAHLEVPKELRPADGIVVLTGGQSRIGTGLDLLKAGKAKRLLISGVHPAARRDDLRLAIGGDRQLFNCCVDIDRAALNTVGNAEESAKWVGANTYASLIV